MSDAEDKTRIPSPVDVHVGARVRAARLEQGMSQEKLGEALELTFQQVQKYEKGINRISASRLHQMSIALGRPIPFFFEGLPEVGDGEEAAARRHEETVRCGEIKDRLRAASNELAELAALGTNLDSIPGSQKALRHVLDACNAAGLALITLNRPGSWRFEGRPANGVHADAAHG